MNPKLITDGNVYEVNVDRVRVPVKVRKVQREKGGHLRQMWHCTRLDTGRALPSAVDSSAIHPRSET